MLKLSESDKEIIPRLTALAANNMLAVAMTLDGMKTIQ